MSGRAVKDTVDLKVRMKEPLRALIEHAAKEHGVSMNAEAVSRLESSFSQEDALGGRAMKRLAHRMVAAFFLAGERASIADGKGDIDAWIQDADCYRAALVALVAELATTSPDWKTTEGRNHLLNAMKSRLATKEANDGAR